MILVVGDYGGCRLVFFFFFFFFCGGGWQCLAVGVVVTGVA